MPYDPAKDRYKQFREALTAYEEGKISSSSFLGLPLTVAANKAAGYKVLCKNYLELEEDYALTWVGRSPVEVNISGLHIATAWYLRTEENNQKRIIFLHFGKEPLAREKERGLLTVLRLAMSDATGVGILNIQPGTLIMATRLNQVEAEFLNSRAARFVALEKEIKSKG